MSRPKAGYRFIVFRGDNYQRMGGWHDMEGCFQNLDSATASVANLRPDQEWAHIVDTETGEIVWPSDARGAQLAG